MHVRSGRSSMFNDGARWQIEVGLVSQTLPDTCRNAVFVPSRVDSGGLESCARQKTDAWACQETCTPGYFALNMRQPGKISEKSLGRNAPSWSGKVCWDMIWQPPVHSYPYPAPMAVMFKTAAGRNLQIVAAATISQLPRFNQSSWSPVQMLRAVSADCATSLQSLKNKFRKPRNQGCGPSSRYLGWRAPDDWQALWCWTYSCSDSEARAYFVDPRWWCVASWLCQSSWKCALV